MDNKGQGSIDKTSAAGMLVAMGIIYGDIGTSPLYVMQGIIDKAMITKEIVYGALSCVFWTITMLTTIKYVIMILRADNKGEGGILALFALIKRQAPYLTLPTILGGAALLADGMITPPISVSSAVEGLQILYPDLNTIPIVIAILTVLFLIQIFGTKAVGTTFGPVMFLWFTTLAILGVYNIAGHLSIFQAINPYYAYQFIVHHEGGFWLLGSVFLCTTGAEALYSDMGHCGRGNIRISWVMVKVCLLINYFGQGAWLLAHEGQFLNDRKPFYAMMPDWFLIPGICIATAATIIASQALITGSFTLIAEAIRLNMWPKVKINYPSDQKGQIYIPSVNVLLYLGCVAVVLYFQKSSNMEAAYGLAITITMLVSTVLFSKYMLIHRAPKILVALFFVVFISIEGSFFVANLIKFNHGGWVSLLLCFLIGSIMIIWQKAYYIKLKLTEFEKFDGYVENLKELSADHTVSKYATHLVFMSNAGRASEIESKIMYSILKKRPKRADVYWFVHVDTMDDPYTKEYKVMTIAPDDIYKINFKLGFRVPQKINLYFRNALEDMVNCGEVDVRSRYESLSKHNEIGDIRFVVLEKFLSYDNDLPLIENIIMKAYFFIKGFTPSEDQWFGLDSSSVKLEKVPMVIKQSNSAEGLKRVDW